MDKKIFAALFSSIFAAVTGVGIVVPLLPVYAHHMGAGGFLIGMIFGVGAGRGIGLFIGVIGLLSIVVSLSGYLYPRTRLVEDELPDAVNQAVEVVEEQASLVV